MRNCSLRPAHRSSGRSISEKIMDKMRTRLRIMLPAAGLLCALLVFSFVLHGSADPGGRPADRGNEPAGSFSEAPGQSRGDPGQPAEILEQPAFDRLFADMDEDPFRASSVTWLGGMAACTEEDGTVFLPCDCSDISDLPAVSDRFEMFLRGLAPVEESCRICVMADSRMEDPALAVREGYAFSAALVSPRGVSRFRIVLTGLPALCMQKTDPEQIRGKEDHSARIRMITPAALTETASGDGGEMYCIFHVRGNVSSALAKKPYKISLKNAAGEKDSAGWLGLREDDDWILNPLFTDSTRVREMTAYALWEKAAAFSDVPQPSSRMRYVELFLDNAYQGIYGLQEPVDKKQLGLSEGDLLYKIDRWDREYPYLDLYEKSEQAGETVINTDRHYPCVEIRWPRSWDDTATWKPMQAFHMFSFRAQDPALLKEAGVSADPDSIVTLSLFCAMTHASDNNWKNTFLLSRRKEDGTYTLYRTIWDLNYVFGDVFVYRPEDGYTVFAPETAREYKPCQDSTYDYEAFRSAGLVEEERLSGKWTAWRQGGIDADLVCSLARTNMDILEAGGALQREMDRWPQEEDPAQALAGMEEWIRRRFVFLDAYFGY